MTTKAELEAMKDFSKLTTREMYKEFNDIHELIRLKESKVTEFSEEQGLVYLTHHTSANKRSLFRERNGFSLSMERFFSTDKQRFLVWYKIKDQLRRHYALVRHSDPIDLSGATVKLSRSLGPYHTSFDLELVREYRNGACIYRVCEGLLYLSHLMVTITENFKGK